MNEVYNNPPEVWNYDKCLKMSKYIAKDGLGTPYPWPGYIGNHYGQTKYNGGCIREGNWYKAESFSLPIIDSNFEIILVPTWGYRIVKA